VYGRTKYEAERLCLSADCDNVVVRISLQYGIKHGRAASFTGWIVSRLQQNMQVPLFTDEYRSPCYVADTARGVLCAAQNARTGEVLHLAGPERIDRYAFGKIVACAYGYPEYLLQPVTRAQKQEAAPRPRDVSFDITKFVDLFMFKPRSVYEGVYDMFSKDKKAH
jgi:dTDP-4-dehydrorhamnose reductase